MEFTGKLISISNDWASGQYRVTFSINEPNELQSLSKLKDYEKLRIEAKKFRKKRSLDANAYAWVLMQKIAEAVNSDKWSVYLECLQNYSRAFTHVIVKPQAVDAMKQLYRTCIDLGDVNVNGETGRQLQVYFGSSTFDTKEMSVFIDGIVSECKQLGIPTITTDEIEHMKSVWSNNGKKEVSAS